MTPDQKPSHQVVDPDAPAPGDDEQMSEQQAAELRELCEKHDEPFDGNLTRREAEQRIESLKARDES